LPGGAQTCEGLERRATHIAVVVSQHLSHSLPIRVRVRVRVRASRHLGHSLGVGSPPDGAHRCEGRHRPLADDLVLIVELASDDTREGASLSLRNVAPHGTEAVHRVLAHILALILEQRHHLERTGSRHLPASTSMRKGGGG
jgi:hypothetical protein